MHSIGCGARSSESWPNAAPAMIRIESFRPASTGRSFASRWTKAGSISSCDFGSATRNWMRRCGALALTYAPNERCNGRATNRVVVPWRLWSWLWPVSARPFGSFK